MRDREAPRKGAGFLSRFGVNFPRLAFFAFYGQTEPQNKRRTTIIVRRFAKTPRNRAVFSLLQCRLGVDLGSSIAGGRPTRICHASQNGLVEPYSHSPHPPPSSGFFRKIVD